MKTYFADANIYLRFILRDDEKQFEQVSQYFTQAKEKKILLVFVPEVITEMDYVLKKVYQVEREISAKYLLALVDMQYIRVENRTAVRAALILYSQQSLDLVDLIILARSCEQNVEVLTFDEKLHKLAQKEE